MQNPLFNFSQEIEKIELAEVLFETDFPVDVAFDNPRGIVDHLIMHLSGWGPSPIAADFLKKLAETHNAPALAQGLHDSWRREQISAVIQEIFGTGEHDAGGDDEAPIPARKPHGPKSGHDAVAQSLDEDNLSGHH